MTDATLAADITRHFHARLHLGRVVVVCDDPKILLAAAAKQWLKLSRELQRRRGAATNAVEIMKFTYTITQMQQLRMVAEAPHEIAGAQVYFVRPEQLRAVPADCLSVYLVAWLSQQHREAIVTELPSNGLVIDYQRQVEATEQLQPKQMLEQALTEKWRQVSYYLWAYHVDMAKLDDPGQRAEAMDDAIDELLEDNDEFLDLARQFQRTLDLARPLRTISKTERGQYEQFMVLAHRVQALSPGGFSTQFLNTYADDMFFLSDLLRSQEAVAQAVQRHEQAGRRRLAQALLRLGRDEAPANAASMAKGWRGLAAEGSRDRTTPVWALAPVAR